MLVKIRSLMVILEKSLLPQCLRERNNDCVKESKKVFPHTRATWAFKKEMSI